MHPFAHSALLGFVQLCGARPAIPIAALLLPTGLLGGLAHCGPMCGPFVLAQSAGAPELRRLQGALLLPYHGGRLLTYAALGAASGGLGAAAIDNRFVHTAAALLLAVAAAGFALHGLSKLLPGWSAAAGSRIGNAFAVAIARLLRPLFRAQTGGARFLLGLALGFLPCGFLYAAVAAAAATGSAAAGAGALAAFALGTTPSLVLVGLGGAAAAARWRGFARRAVPALFLFNGGVLALLAMHTALAAP